MSAPADENVAVSIAYFASESSLPRYFGKCLVFDLSMVRPQHLGPKYFVVHVQERLDFG